MSEAGARELTATRARRCAPSFSTTLDPRNPGACRSPDEEKA